MAEDRILLDHGSGGRASHELVGNLFLRYLNNPILEEMHDSALLEIEGGRLAFSTDSYVVDPIFFPGGDIGSLAIHGTVNDLAMRGAKPLYLSAGFILEEGLMLSDLERIAASMGQAAKNAGVWVVAGDTKVVPRGAADKIFINTSGVGVIPPGISISGKGARPKDQVLISGTIGDHGVTILSQREGLSFSSTLKSDSAPLNYLVACMLEVSPRIHVLRDPTRGGLATTLNEIALQSKVGIEIFEGTLPFNPAVLSACEILGLDPLYLANEGKLVAFMPPEDAPKVLEAMRAHPYGGAACLIGRVVDGHPGRVTMKTLIGGTRIVDMLTGEQLPRIC